MGTQRLSLLPMKMTQVTRIVRALGISDNVSGARLVLSTPTPGGAFAAYAAVSSPWHKSRTFRHGVCVEIGAATS
jgi:hypothetical protein